MSMRYFIYFHKNQKTQKVFYVGLGTNDRYKDFKYGRNPYYLNYVEKYGEPIVEIVHKNLTKGEACTLEVEYIQKYGRKLYDEGGILVNISEGGSSGSKGYKYDMSQERKDKISKSKKGKSIHTKKSKNLISKSKIGSKISDETKSKISKSHLGKKKSDETKAKMSKAHKGRKITWNLKGIKKSTPTGKPQIPISQYDLNGKFIKSYQSISDASNGDKSLYEGIRQCLKGKYKQSKGYIWKKS